MDAASGEQNASSYTPTRLWAPLGGKYTAEAYLLVDAEAQGGLGYVEHDTGAAVVVLERHTLVDGRVALDVHVVSPLQAQAQDPAQHRARVSEAINANMYVRQRHNLHDKLLIP